jgi:type II secretory pathway pseudopilin PulG
MVELMVAMVITGLLLGVIFQLMQGQGRYVSRQSAKEEVQQNNRAALDLIGSELRTVPSGNGIEMAAEDSIGIRSVRLWAVVCVGSGGGTSVSVRMPILPGASFATNLGTHFVADVDADAAAEAWTSPVRVTEIGAPVAVPPASCLFETETSLPAGIEVRTLSLGSTPTNAATSEEPVTGDPAYVYDLVTYRTGESSTGGEWIQRRLGSGSGASNQPMAGPVPHGEGLEFTYYAGTTVVPTPITDEATRASVDRLSMIVRTVSRNQMSELRQAKTDTITVSLRNRIQ